MSYVFHQRCISQRKVLRDIEFSHTTSRRGRLSPSVIRNSKSNRTPCLKIWCLKITVIRVKLLFFMRIQSLWLFLSKRDDVRSNILMNLYFATINQKMNSTFEEPTVEVTDYTCFSPYPIPASKKVLSLFKELMTTVVIWSSSGLFVGYPSLNFGTTCVCGSLTLGGSIFDPSLDIVTQGFENLRIFVMYLRRYCFCVSQVNADK